MKKFLECGKIVTTHGIRGEVKVMPWTDSPDVLCDFKTLYFNGGQNSIKVISARVQKNMVLIKFEGFDLIEQSRELIGCVLFADRNDFDLKDGAVFIQDLIGLEVIDVDTQKNYGKIADVSPTGANDVFHIKGDDGKMRYLPHIKSMVIDIDLQRGVVLARPLEGLFDED